MTLPPSEPAVLARDKQAIQDDDRSGALALLHVLLSDGPETAATLTPVLAQALIATARTEPDAGDQRARRSFDKAHVARTQICQLLRSAPLDSDDLVAIRAALEDRERELDHELRLRLAEHREGSTPELCGSGWAGSTLLGCQALGSVSEGAFSPGGRPQTHEVHRQGVRLAATWSPRTARG